MKLLFTILSIYFLFIYNVNARQYTVTAYCNCKKCCGKWAAAKKTANNTTPREGITVAGSRSLKFGTVVRIDGVGVRIVEDRLAKKYDSRFDVYFRDHERARKFGIQKLDVEIISIPKGN